MPKRNSWSGSLVAGLLIVSTSLSACATNPDGTTPNVFSDISAAFGSSDVELTPEQVALREQERDYSKARLNAALAGAAIGVIAGGLLGAAVGGREGAVTGAAMGLAAGGATGYVGGTYLTRDHTQFVADRDTLQKDIETARADSVKMKRNVQVAEGALASQRSLLNRVNADLRAGRITEAQAREQAKTAAEDLASVRALAEESDRRVTNLNKSVSSYKQASLPTRDLTKELKVQKTRAASLRRVERSMVTAINRTPANIRPSV